MTSSRIPGRFPPAGSSRIADLIRQRRGARGLTPLDGALLHVPPVAEGWNLLLGAVRSKGKLPGDVREAMVSSTILSLNSLLNFVDQILRVAALNDAAFEWIQHEPVGRDGGLTTGQLRLIRDTTIRFSGLTADQSPLTPLHSAALAFTDASTKEIKIPEDVFKQLKVSLSDLTVDDADESKEYQTEDLLAEAAAVVATYNMVSRFLVSLDVAGKSDEAVPWPVDRREVRLSTSHLTIVLYLTVLPAHRPLTRVHRLVPPIPPRPHPDCIPSPPLARTRQLPPHQPHLLDPYPPPPLQIIQRPPLRPTRPRQIHCSLSAHHHLRDARRRYQARPQDAGDPDAGA